jgi:hypothetical protein
MNTQFIGANVQGYQVATRVRAAKHWLVRASGNVIGPVSIELLERGLEAGKIPSDAEMALLGGNEWRQITEIFPAPPPEASEAPAEPVTFAPFPVPPATPSGHFLDDPVNIPKQGMLAALFG